MSFIAPVPYKTFKFSSGFSSIIIRSAFLPIWNVAGYALGIYDKSKSPKEIMSHIEKTLDGDLTPPFRKMIRLLRSEGEFKGPQLVLLILHIIRPDGFPDKPPQPLSDKLFEEYLLEKQSGKLLPRDKEALLAQCLTSQLCHCIKSQFLGLYFK